MDHSKLITVLGSVLTFAIGLLQMYVTLRLMKYKEVVKQEIMDEFNKQISEVYKDISKIDNNMVTKEVLELKMQNLQHQIKNSGRRGNT